MAITFHATVDISFMEPLGTLADSHRGNAIFGWLMTAVVIVGAVESFVTDEFLWAGFALFIVFVIAVPAVTRRKWSAMVPWPLVSVAALAVMLRATGFYLELAGYVAIATTALIIVIEFVRFTSVELSRRFAVTFAILTTMAIQAIWVIFQYYSDAWFGTSFLRSQVELQWDFVLVTGVGILFGILFGFYFGRTQPVGSADRRSSET